MPPQHLAESLATEGLSKYLWNEQTRRSLSPFFKSARGTPTFVYFKWDGAGGLQVRLHSGKTAKPLLKTKKRPAIYEYLKHPPHTLFWLSHDIHPTRRAIKSGLFKLKQMDKSQPRRPIRIWLNHINQ